MTLLVAGILLLAGLHFIPTLAPGLRRALHGRIGELPYKAVFALGNIAAIVLMVKGWGAADQWDLYEPPQWGRPVAVILILSAFLLFAFARLKTNVKRFIRHPQLTGMVTWAIGHLLVNGDNLAMMLFGGLGLWAVAEIVLISRREGPWQKPDPVPLTVEILPVVIGLVLFAAFLYAHAYLFGVSPFPQ